MEVNNFITTEFLSSFTGTLFVVELIVFVTKNLPIIKKIRTRGYTFILSIIHITLIGFATKTAGQTLVYYYSVMINSLMVTVMLCGGYDIIVERVYSATNNYKEINYNGSIVKDSDSNDSKDDQNKVD